MQPNWLQQQQRAQQQRQREMGAAWQEMQRRKKPNIPGAVPPGASSDPFSQVETRVAELRQELNAGRLSAADYAAKLQNLMIQDRSGAWWMVGAETGSWYRYNGREWVQDVPSGRPTLRPEIPPADRARRGGSSLKAFLALIVGVAVTLVVGWLVGAGSYELFQEFGDYSTADSMSLVCAGIVWISGLVLSIRWSRRTALV